MVMHTSVQVDFHANIQQIFGEKSVQITLETPPTVRKLLNILCPTPKRYNEIFDSAGNLRGDVKILRNGRNIVFLDGLDTQLNNGDTIAIFPPVFGG
jgi:molybdopterin synthase sulfur carrier subunit